ncbi:uncharacterized protein LOC126191166 [Schistocerca cancellata]|uniref:uncharacterized protein LOC126191166 n=1 Tax=Schistocerca cancellata TaxID=274614 RepID=UPI0021189B5A|nr:uncharacterized protein LOC126191166 [Schistocerca cancellata]
MWLRPSPALPPRRGNGALAGRPREAERAVTPAAQLNRGADAGPATRVSPSVCARSVVSRSASVRAVSASTPEPLRRRLRPTRRHLAGTQDTPCCGFRSPGPSCAGDLAPMDVLPPCLPGRCTQVSEERPAEVAE